MSTFEPISKPNEMKMAMDVMQSRRAEERMRDKLLTAAREMARHVENLKSATKEEYTGWIGLFRETDGRWECVATVDTNNLPDWGDTEEEPQWDMAVPIPKPGTVSEFSGW